MIELYSPMRWFLSPSVDWGQVWYIQISIKFRLSRLGVGPRNLCFKRLSEYLIDTISVRTRVLAYSSQGMAALAYSKSVTFFN